MWVAPGGEREAGLDVLRAVALVRVVVWHTFGAAIITYFVAAVPAMFFVTGSLLARSLARRSARAVIADRLRRVLIPLALYSSLSYLSMAIAYRRDPSDVTAIPVKGMWLWFFPLADPSGSPWEGGHLSSALWYMRALVWLFLLAPLLMAMVRRWWTAALYLPLGALFALDWIGRHPNWSIRAMPNLVWQAGDIALYAFFLQLGFLHRFGWFKTLHRSDLVMLVILCSSSAAVWKITQPVPGGVVNNSHPMHLFVGSAWLMTALVAMPWLSRLAELPSVAPALRALTRRSLTIYLWHPLAIVVAYHELDSFSLPAPLFAIAVVAVVATLTAALVSVFGWLEDKAAGRTPSSLFSDGARPRLAFSLSIAVLLLITIHLTPAPTLLEQVTASVPLTAPGSTRRPPIPSQAPPRVSDSVLSASAIPAAKTVAPPRLQPTEGLQSIVTAWAAHYRFTGVQVGTAAQGTYSLATTSTQLNETFAIASVTKTYTAAIIYQLSQEGRLDLDAPLPPLAAVPDFPYSEALTARLLLSHSSGLVNYRDTARYKADPQSIASAAAAVRASVSEPLKFAPGTQRDYSSTNYLLLGLLAEQVAGQRFDALLDARIIDALGLSATSHLASAPGEPNFSTAGIVTDVIDLLRWGGALLRDGKVVSAESLAQMTTVNDTTGLGAGAEGWCPCVARDDGTVSYHYIGHADAHTLLLYSAADDMVMVITFDQNLYLDQNVQAVDVLIDSVRSYVLTTTR